MPSTGSRSWRCRTAQTVPPCASVWCTARSRPSSRRSICVPSSGQAPPSIRARPQAGHSQASWSTPSWKSSRSTRPSEAASSVGPQPEEARPLRPASSCQRSTASVSCSARHDSSSGSTSSSSSAGVACASALVQPMIALRASCESSLSNSDLRLLGGDDDQLRPAQPADLPVDLLGDLLQVVVDELLDVPLVARLRPAALVVAAGVSSCCSTISSSRPARRR